MLDDVSQRRQYLVGRGRGDLWQVGLSLLHVGISGRLHDIALFPLYK